MPIAPLTLDDLRWADLVDRARRRIPAVSGGEWTLHAPVDPGITILELYAWLLEQRVFWMDQPTSALSLALLRLLGPKFEPRPTRAAVTVLHFSAPGESKSYEFGMVRDQTVFQTTTQTDPLRFAVDRGVTVLPVRRVRLFVGEQDRSEDLRQGWAPVLLGGPGEGPTRIRLEMHALAADPWALVGPLQSVRLSLMLDLLTTAEIAEQWVPGPDAEVEPEPLAHPRWSAAVRPGRASPVGVEKLDDGSLGFLRSGIVSFDLRGPWDALPRGKPWAIDLFLDVPDPPESPVRVRRLLPNVALARNLVRFSTEGDPDVLERLNARAVALWRPGLPGNVLPLPEEMRPSLEASIRLRLRDEEAEADWEPVVDFTRSGPEDRVFIVDAEAHALRFGDGRKGKIPSFAEPKPIVQLVGEVCAGATGNLGPMLDWSAEPDNDSLGSQATKNVTRAAGGADPETADQVSERAASARRRPDRAVTLADFEAIARDTPGVAVRRARAVAGMHPDFPGWTIPGAVTVFVVPDTPRPALGDDDDFPEGYALAPVPAPRLLRAVRSWLETSRLLTSEVFVAPPVYRHVRVALDVESDDPDPEEVRRVVARAVALYLDPLVGGPRGDGWLFGESIRPSELIKDVEKMVPDRPVVVRRVRLAFAPPTSGSGPADDCDDLALGANELPVAAQVEVAIISPRVRRRGLP